MLEEFANESHEVKTAMEKLFQGLGIRFSQKKF